ncbi:hypothetical protein MITS9509_01735 [Synechococcus sp. MIT S9509]|nr:hypothetical protein MITS9509_01735 [Synechococcus sp. MIT S9509]
MTFIPLKELDNTLRISPNGGCDFGFALRCLSSTEDLRIDVKPHEIDSMYWKYLQGISYHHFKGYLKQLDAEEYFAELYPGVLKKLQACAAICVCEEE